MPSSPTVRRRELSTALRKPGTEPSLTAEEIANEMEWSSSKISRVETTAPHSLDKTEVCVNRVGQRANTAIVHRA